MCGGGETDGRKAKKRRSSNDEEKEFKKIPGNALPESMITLGDP